MTAFELPSRADETVNASSLTTPSLLADGAAELTRLISRVAVWPALTVNVSFIVL